MKIIEERPLREGGSCAECDSSYTAFSGKRVLAEYYDGEGMLTEPFNICYQCYQRYK